MDEMHIPSSVVRKLLGAGSGDAALLYLFVQAGGLPENASAHLRIPAYRIDAAAALLRQLGIWTEAPSRSVLSPAEAPRYTEQDVIRAQSEDADFVMLLGEAQRRLGRILSTEEQKILLNMRNYLGLPDEVITLLLSYCMERNRERGNPRPPTLRQIERAAYAWADSGIDTLEDATAYIQLEMQRRSRIAPLRRILQLGDRKLSKPEERYLNAWIAWDFPDETIRLAYEKTCVTLGRFDWRYLNGILKSWHELNLRTPEQVRDGDLRQSPQRPQRTRGAAQANPNPPAPGNLGEMERNAIARMLQEDK